jgi:hypothetical protein
VKRLLIALLLLAPAAASAQTTTHGITIPSGHPRILFSDPTRLAAARAWYAAHPFTRDGDPVWKGPYVYGQMALRSLLSQNAADGCTEAIVWLKAYDITNPQHLTAYNYLGGQDYVRWALPYGPMVYDWCYQWMTPADRAAAITMWNANQTAAEAYDQPLFDLGGIDFNNGSRAGPFGNYYTGMEAAHWYWALASYDPDLNATVAESWLHNAADLRMVGEFEPYANTSMAGGINSESGHYGQYARDYRLIPLESARQMGRDVFAETPWWLASVYAMVYAAPPAQSTQYHGPWGTTPASTTASWDYFPFGDEEFWNTNDGGGDQAKYASLGNFMTWAATRWNGTNAGGFAAQFLASVAPSADYYHQAYANLPAARSFTNLPLDYYAKGPGFFYGHSHRPWTSGTSFAIQMGWGWVESGHGHADYGTWQLWRGGRWVSRETTYFAGTGLAGYGGSGTATTFDTVMHNGLLVGGQGSSTSQPGRNRQFPVPTRVESQPGYAFASVNIGPTYTNVTSAVRDFVFVRDLEALIILDRVNASSALTRASTVHCEQQWASTSSSRRTCSLTTGTAQTLVVDSLLPAAPTFRSIYENGGSESNHIGQYRLEIEDSPGTAQSYLLTVVQANGASPFTPTITTNDTTTIVVDLKSDGTHLVTFAKGMTSTGGSVTISGTTTNLRSDVQGMTVSTDGVVWDGQAPTTTNVTVSIVGASGAGVAGQIVTPNRTATLVGATGTGVAGTVTATASGSGTGTTWYVGPGRTYTTVAAVQGLVQPGDLVLIDGGNTYGSTTITGGGTAGNPVTYRGTGSGAGRPTFSGGTNTIQIDADHVVVDNVIVTGGSSRCIFYTSDDVTVRNSHITACPQHGILSSDLGSGSAVVEYNEIDHCGSGSTRHPVYVTSDQSAHPGAVFTFRYNYTHDQNGGHTLKTRAQRTEILYNWMEGSFYRDLECVGADTQGTGAVKLYPQHCELIGNVIRKTTANVQAGLRFGTDGTSGSNGQVRLVNNTILREAGTGPTIYLMGDTTGGLESIELHNNVFYATNGTPDVLSDVDLGAYWVAGRQVAGSNNWTETGSTEVPSEWTGTVTGADPGFTTYLSNMTPTSGSALRDAGGSATSYPAGHQFPSPLTTLPQYMPATQTVVASAAARPTSGTIDIGAFEYNAGGGTNVTASPAGATGTGVAGVLSSAGGATRTLAVAAGAGASGTLVTAAGATSAIASAAGDGTAGQLSVVAQGTAAWSGPVIPRGARVGLSYLAGPWSAPIPVSSSPAGAVGTAVAGVITSSAGAVSALAGASSTGAAGVIVAAVSALAPLVAAAGVGTAGALSTSVGIVATPAGASAAGLAGIITAVGNTVGGSTAVLSGASATGAAASVLSAAGALNSVAGASTTGAASTIASVASAVAPIAGAGGVGSAGVLTSISSAVATVVGASAPGYAGTVTTTASGPTGAVTVSIAAAISVGVAGQAVTAAGAVVTLAGAAGTGYAAALPSPWGDLDHAPRFIVKTPRPGITVPVPRPAITVEGR